MANTSILAAFERMWQHVVAALGNKSDINHTHDEYYTESEVDTALAGKANASHTHTIANITDLQSTLNGKAASSHNHAASNITSGTLSSDRLPTVPVAKGGTGATTEAAARTNLDVYSKSEVDTKLSGKSDTGHTHDYVPTSRTVNGKVLSANINLSASDVGADASGSAAAVQTNLNTHNTNSAAHKDIRDELTEIHSNMVSVTIGNTAPASGPALWLDTSTATNDIGNTVMYAMEASY